MTIHPLDLPPISYSEYERKAVEPSAARTVVLGYDGSPASRAAARRAGELAGPGGRVVAVRAVSTASGDDFAGLEEDALGGARLERRLAADGAARAIADTARSCHADHIVIGWGARAPGHVFTTLVKSAICPVVVVPSGPVPSRVP